MPIFGYGVGVVLQPPLFLPSVRTAEDEKGGH